MFRLKTLGCLRLDKTGGEAVESPRRHLALLALLAGAGDKGVARERLAAFLWPKVSADNGRHSLEQLLSTLRGRLGPGAFDGTDPVRLEPQVIAADVGEFTHLFRAEAFELAVGLYGGPFLDGFYLGGSKEFEDWTERERARLAGWHIEALERLGRQAEIRGETAAAVRWWRQVVEADPLRAKGALGLMGALAADGDRAAAVRHARVYQRLVRDQLDLPPQPAVIQLAAQLEEPSPRPTIRVVVPSAPPGAPPVEVAVAVAAQPVTISSRTFRLGRPWVRVVVAALLLLGTAVSLRSLGFSRTLREPGWVLVADFEGPTDDPALTRAVRELVSSALIESGRAVTVPVDQVQEARRMARLDDTMSLTVAVARHLAFRTAVEMVVDGSVTPVGNEGYSLVFRLVEVTDGRVIGSASGFASDRTIMAESRRLTGKLTAWIRPFSPHSSEAALPPRVVTSSFEAYRRFASGVEQYQNGDMVAASRSFREALDLDPEFADAWLQLGMAAGWIDFTDSSTRAFQRAALHVDRLSAAGRNTLAVQLTARTADRILALERIIQMSPVTPDEYFERGRNLQQLGRYAEAVADMQKADSNWPMGTPARIVIERTLLLIALGEFDSAKLVGRDLSGVFRHGFDVHLAISSGDWQETERLAMERLGDLTLPPARRFRLTLMVACARASRGRLREANRLLAEAEVMAIREGISRGGGGDHSRLGPQRLLQALSSGGSPSGPPLRAPEDTSIDAMILDGIWAAFTDNSGRAKRLLDSVRARGLDDGYGFWRDLLGLEASLAAVKQDWAAVSRALSRVAYEGGGQIEGGLVFRRWLAADAYERLGQLDSAATFFEMIVSPVRTSWWENFAKGPASPFAHRRLALLYTRMGKHHLARRHWSSFLGMFTEPDPDLRWMVAEAQQEVRKLEM